MAPYSMAGLLSCASERVHVTWSGRYHLTKEASRFILSVSHPPEPPGQHGDLRGHLDAYRCCVKSLIASALVGIGERQHARPESISKRARSITPTSLRFRINEFRAALTSVAQNPPSRISGLTFRVLSIGCGDACDLVKSNCVRPSNVVRSRTAICLSRCDSRERIQT